MRDFSIIKKNILYFIESQNISKYELYKNTGISNGVLSQKGGMSEENTIKFLSYYKEISADWLLTGEGSMLKTSGQNVVQNSGSDSINAQNSNVTQHNNNNELIEMLKEKDKQITMLIEKISK